MYDELVKRLHRYTENCVAYKLDADFADAVQQAADAIEELSKPRWIPVTERLPENGEYVLCFCRANIVCVLRRDKDGDWYENPTHVYMSGFVTHWMPLPSPPKEES
jgi:hypothetical protein